MSRTDPRPRRFSFLRATGLGLALCALVQGVGGRAWSAEVPIDVRYAIEVAGVPVAEAALTVSPIEGGLASRLVVQSVGLAAAWSGARSELRALIQRAGEGGVLPRSFEASHVKRDRARKVRIRYDRAGAVVEAKVASRGRERASEVPEDLRRGTVDPLTAFERLRAWLAEAVAGRAPPETTVAIFDGRKRLDLEVRYLGRIANADGRVEGFELSARLIGRFGFEPEDGVVELPNGDRPSPLRVLVEPTNSLLPVRIEVPDRPAGPVITLRRDCRVQRCPPA